MDGIYKKALDAAVGDGTLGYAIATCPDCGIEHLISSRQYVKFGPAVKCQWCEKGIDPKEWK